MHQDTHFSYIFVLSWGMRKSLTTCSLEVANCFLLLLLSCTLVCTIHSLDFTLRYPIRLEGWLFDWLCQPGIHTLADDADGECKIKY